MLGLRFCARAFSSCGKRGPLLILVREPLTIVASLVAEHRLQTGRLSNCGSRAQLLRGMWDPPRPGLEPVSPALAGRFSTTAPPGKPWCVFHHYNFVISRISCKWNNMVCTLLKLASYLWDSSQLSCVSMVRSFWLLNSYQLYRQATVGYPFSSGRALWLFLVWGNYECSCCKYLCRGFCVNINFHYSRVKIPRSSASGSYGLKELSNCLLEGLYHFAFHLTGFHLHFPNDQ